MNIENGAQTIEVTPKRKGHGGRPRKDPSEKRSSALMLRLNVAEQKKLHQLIKSYGWTGDPSSFVRDLILSDEGQGGGSDLMALEYCLGVLHTYLVQFEDKATPEQKEIIEQIKPVIHKASQAIYNNN